MKGKGVGGSGGGIIAEEEEEEHHRNPFFPNTITASTKLLSPKIQFRKDISKAKWQEDMGMAEILEKKGSIWATTGVVRDSKLYCHIEEILFLAEKGALILTTDDDETLGLLNIYKKLAGGNMGCSWESFEAYKHLKTLGYIIGRHDVPWTTKGNRSSGKLETNGTSGLKLEERISTLLKEMNVNELRPIFDVYLPNSKFKKSAPGDPSFILCLCSNSPPSRLELENLEKSCGNVPLRICYVDHGRVSFFSCDQVLLPALP